MLGDICAPNDCIEIKSAPINLQALIDYVKDPLGGAIVTFSGTTRGDTGWQSFLSLSLISPSRWKTRRIIRLYSV